MKRWAWRCVVLVGALAASRAGTLAAQTSAQGDARSQLVARGLSADLAAQVSAVAQETAGKGLPAQLIVNKAIEGWFKHVPPPRIIAAVRDLSQRLERARAELTASGVAAGGSVIGAAAEARAQGVSQGDEVTIIRTAPDSSSAAAGLSVAAALVVQGIDAGTSARLVIASFRAGKSAAQVLDLPAAARALEARGTAVSDVGRRLLEGIGADAQGNVNVRGTVKAPLIPPGTGLPVKP